MLSEAKHLAVGMRIWCSQLKIFEAKTIKSSLKSFSANERSLASLGMTAKRGRDQRSLPSSGGAFGGPENFSRDFTKLPGNGRTRSKMRAANGLAVT